MTLLILVSYCPALGLSSPRPELGLGKDVVAVLTWGQVWWEDGATVHQMQHRAASWSPLCRA